MFEPTVLARLRGIGLTSTLIHQLSSSDHIDTDTTLMRVCEVQRAGLTLHDGANIWPARLLPALRAKLAETGQAIAVGDWVLVGRDDFGACWAQRRLAPFSQLARRLHQEGRDKVTRAVIVSNVDLALLVMGLDHDFNLRRLERYAALVRLAGVAAVVVLTKTDLCADSAARLAELQTTLPGLPAIALDATRPDAADQLSTRLGPWLSRDAQGASPTLVLLGSSGAGKSTLTNALLGSERQLTGTNREGDSRGRHTTTTRSLHLTPAGACIIDTPGLRTLRLDGDAERLGAVFDDITRLALSCRFSDCRHEAEPGCAVRAGVDAERLHNFHKLQREATRDTRTALERKVEVAQWKSRGRLARERVHAKRG
jgi:ribosome biogenesis GTPase